MPSLRKFVLGEQYIEGVWIDRVQSGGGMEFFGLINISPDDEKLCFSVENVDRTGGGSGRLVAKQIQMEWPTIVFKSEGNSREPKYNEGIVSLQFEGIQGVPNRFSGGCLDKNLIPPVVIEGWRITDEDMLKDLQDPEKRKQSLQKLIANYFP